MSGNRNAMFACSLLLLGACSEDGPYSGRGADGGCAGGAGGGDDCWEVTTPLGETVGDGDFGAPDALALPSIAVVGAPTVVPLHGLFEARALIVAGGNPFDPLVVDSTVTFFGPGGIEAVSRVFWYLPHSFDDKTGIGAVPAGDGQWLVRFTPTATGQWTWRWDARVDGERFSPATGTFIAEESGTPGFLRRSQSSQRHLRWDTGEYFFAIGQNLAWLSPQGDVRVWEEFIDRMHQAGANTIRLWMASWDLAIEWSDTGLGDYSERMDRAWLLDRILEMLEERGMVAMLCLHNHGPFSTIANSEWNNNPYNKLNGGPLSKPEEFFVDQTARFMTKRKLSYIVARWGYSRAIMAWELFNEVDMTDASVGFLLPSDDIIAWHREMAEHLRQIDPNKHLVTTSTASSGKEQNFASLAYCDFAQFHSYGNATPWIKTSDLALNVLKYTKEYFDANNIPVLGAEVDAGHEPDTDPSGHAVHDAMWAGVVAGGMGLPMAWWWDAPVGMTYQSVQRAVSGFLAGIAWDVEAFEPEELIVQGGNGSLRGTALVGNTMILVWVKDERALYDVPRPWPVVGDGAFDLASIDRVGVGDRDGVWSGSWVDTSSGEVVRDITVDLDQGSVISIPPFVSDLALRLER